MCTPWRSDALSAASQARDATGEETAVGGESDAASPRVVGTRAGTRHDAAEALQPAGF